jgi:hypothetical protein
MQWNMAIVRVDIIKNPCNSPEKNGNGECIFTNYPRAKNDLAVWRTGYEYSINYCPNGTITRIAVQTQNQLNGNIY